jgi:hypothetical protein
MIAQASFLPQHQVNLMVVMMVQIIHNYTYIIYRLHRCNLQHRICLSTTNFLVLFMSVTTVTN